MCTLIATQVPETVLDCWRAKAALRPYAVNSTGPQLLLAKSALSSERGYSPPLLTVNQTLHVRNVSADPHVQHSVGRPATEETRVPSGLAVVGNRCAPVTLEANFCDQSQDLLF